MRTRGKYVVLLGVGVLAGGLVALVVPSDEPSYGGRTLSDWVEMAYWPPLTNRLAVSAGFIPMRLSYVSGMPSEAEEAIRDMGAKGLPYLVRWIRYEPLPWKACLLAGINRTVGSGLLDRRYLRACGA